MKLISVDDIKQGMMTAKAVTDPTGMLLLKENTELTPVWVQRLKARKITSVYVVDDGSSSDQSLSQEQLNARIAEIDKKVDRMFSDCLSNPVMASLAESARNQLKSKIKI